MGGPGSGGRPKGSQDADAARAGLQEEIQRPTKGGAQKKGRPQVTPPSMVSEPLTNEEVTGAGLMVQDVFKMVASMRGAHWNLVPDDSIDRVGRPTALVLRKYGPMADRYPEISLAIILAPGIFGALKAEYEIAKLKAQAARAARSAQSGVVTPLSRVERGDPRAQGLGEDHGGAVVVGTPLEMPDR